MRRSRGGADLSELDTAGLQAFRDYLSREGHANALDFYLTLRNIQHQFLAEKSLGGVKTLDDHCKELYQKFIDAKSPHFLRFLSSGVQQDTKTEYRSVRERENYSRRRHTLKPSLFDPAFREVCAFLHDRLRRFREGLFRLEGSSPRSSTLPRHPSSQSGYRSTNSQRRSFSRETHERSRLDPPFGSLLSPYSVPTDPSFRSDDGNSSLTMTDSSTLVEDPLVKVKKRDSRRERGEQRARSKTRQHHLSHSANPNHHQSSSRHRHQVPSSEASFSRAVTARLLDRNGNTSALADRLSGSLRLSNRNEEEEEDEHEMLCRQLDSVEADDEGTQKIKPSTSTTPDLRRNNSFGFFEQGGTFPPPPLRPPPLPRPTPPPHDDAYHASCDSGMSSAASSAVGTGQREPILASGGSLPPPVASSSPLPTLPSIPPPLPPLRQKNTGPMEVMYYVGAEDTPFLMRWETPPERLTLAAVKLLLPPKLRDAKLHRYFFLCCEGWQDVYREVSLTEDTIPLSRDGKVTVKILPK